MAGFLYFLPGAKQSELADGTQLSAELMRRFQLAEVLRDCSSVPDHVVGREAVGPDDEPGLVLTISDGNPSGAWGYKPRQQEWRKAEDGSKRWVGWLTQDPPTSEALKRRTALTPRWVVTDAKGNEWSIVTARSSESQSAMLPCDYTFRAGKMEAVVQSAYRDLFELSARVYDHMAALLADEDDEFASNLKSEDWLVRCAVEVIAANYRIGIAEVAVLQELGHSLISTENVNQILACFIDRPLMEEFVEWNKALRQKKTESLAQNSESSCSGPEDSTINMHQHAAGSS